MADSKKEAWPGGQEQEQFSEAIRLNFMKLVQHTKCTPKLLNVCWSQKILTDDEREEIESARTSGEKSTKFYHFLRVKDVQAIRKAVEVLRVHNSSQIPYEIFNTTCSVYALVPIAEQHRAASPDQIRNICADVTTALPKPPINSFFGRQPEIEGVHEVLVSVPDGDVHIACVTGLGGVGKSELVRAYAQRYRQFYDGNCLWINADCASSIQESILAIAGDLDIPVQRSQGRDRPLQGIMGDVYRRLSPVKSLVIFDNVEAFSGPNGVSVVLPNLPPGVVAPWILMTSRVTNWALVDCFCVQEFPLKVPSLAESTAFLQKQLGLGLGLATDADTDGEGEEELKLAEKLCAELQCLPLALQQAVGYIGTDIRRQGRTASKAKLLRNYLTRSQKQESVFADRRCQKMSDRYADTIMTTWSLTMKKIRGEEHDEHAILWLQTLALRRPFDIPEPKFIRDTLSFAEQEECVRILNSVFNVGLDDQDEESVHQSLNLLANYSMIRMEEGLISFHRLVGQVLLFQLQRERKEEAILRLVVQPMTCLAPSEFDTRRVELCKYWQHCLPYDELVRAFSTSIGVRVNKDGLFNYPLEDTVKRFEAVLGGHHEDTLAAKLICATQYGKPEYLDQLPALLETCTENLGPEHKITLGAERALVNHQIKGGRYKNALELSRSRLRVNADGENQFEYASERVLYTLAKEKGNGSLLEEISGLYDGWRRETQTSPDSLHSLHWIFFRGMVVALMLQGKHNEALQMLNTELEPYKSEPAEENPDRVKHVAKNYAEIMSFLEDVQSKDVLVKNLLHFWDISKPGASEKKKYGDWWLALNEEISGRHEEFIELNKVFGERVSHREDFSNFVPYGFVIPMEDFLRIDTGLTRYKRTVDYLVLISVRDLECDKELKKLPVDDELMGNLMGNIQALLSLGTGALGPQLKYVAALLGMHYNWQQVAAWQNGKFLMFLVNLAKNGPAPAFAVQILGFLHLILHGDGASALPMGNLPDGLVSGLLSLSEKSESSLRCKVYQVLITLTDNKDHKVLAEEEIETLLVSLNKCQSGDDADSSQSQEGIDLNLAEQRRWILWILSNLADTNVISEYACLNAILEAIAELVESPGFDFLGQNPSTGIASLDLEAFLVHSTIVFIFFAQIQTPSPANKLDPCLSTRLQARVESNLKAWIQSARAFDFLGNGNVTLFFSSLEPFLRLAFLNAEHEQHFYHLFSTWTLANLVKSDPDRYAPMILAWPAWWERFTELSSCECECEPATSVIQKFMTIKYSAGYGEQDA